MSDNPALRGGQDRQRIDVHQAHELRYWSQELGVSPGYVRQAVEQVGDRVDEVRQYLARGGAVTSEAAGRSAGRATRSAAPRRTARAP